MFSDLATKKMYEKNINTIHIINSREKLDDNNEIKKIIPFIKSEFGKLLDLYYFMSWSENNNYI